MTDHETLPGVEHPTTGYMTLQFANGGLFDGEPVGHAIHLVRSTGRGTPGPTLCLLPRFDEGGHGWSVGGGISDPDAFACPSCDAARDRTLPVGGSMFGRLYPSSSDERGLAEGYPTESVVIDSVARSTQPQRLWLRVHDTRGVHTLRIHVEGST